ncbi:unnamed protein product [Polarella glacialis]|uniref:Fe2OG dioxygenase domain-containing protein n=1 Tax=Polarella glacialis TaxID=89957 RepID=A0A813GPG5_POLGL|nr:unnamed protein product [Polarella glacialis]
MAFRPGFLLLALRAILAVSEPCSVLFVNQGKHPITLEYVPPGDEPNRYIGQVVPGQQHSEDSHCGHQFALRVEKGPPTTVLIKSAGKVLFKAQTVKVVVEPAGALIGSEMRLDTPGMRAQVEATRKECQIQFQGHQQDVDYFCSKDFDHRFYVEARVEHTDAEFKKKHGSAMKERERGDRHQPPKFSTFTDVGFKVGSMPQDLHTELLRFHSTERLTKAKPENMLVFCPNLSGRESDTWLLALPQDLRNKIETSMRPILAKWSGFEPDDLQLTAIYGVRLYHNGSVLYDHVDRVDTHVISAILEVQHMVGGAEADAADKELWPLHILDHDGGQHRVRNQVGQMILYESATCAHGRPQPFIGREFANVFVHFAPRGWPDKFRVQPGQPRGFRHPEL